MGSTVRFEITGASLSTNPRDIQVFRNNGPVPEWALQISAAGVSVDFVLEHGRNHLLFSASDSEGRLLFKEVTLWAGAERLFVTVLDETGQALLDKGGALSVLFRMRVRRVAPEQSKSGEEREKGRRFCEYKRRGCLGRDPGMIRS